MRVLLWIGCASTLLLGACQNNPKRAKPTLAETRAIAAGQPVGAPTVEAETNAPDSTEPAQPKTRRPAEDPVVATVAGQPIRTSDLLASWMFRDSQGAREVLDRLVLDGLAQAEASRLGIQLDPQMVAADWKSTLAEFDAEIEKASPGTTREAFVEERLGLDAAGYLRRMADRRRLDLLAARCVRAFALESESMEARLLVAPDRRTADRVEAGLAQGKPFEALVREFSIDSSKETGGRIPPVIRSRATIARLVFATPIGEVGGPLQERGRFLYVLPESHRPATAGPWSELGPQVEVSLAQRPIEDLEFVQWQAMVLARYEVDTRPLLELAGEPTGE